VLTCIHPDHVLRPRRTDKDTAVRGHCRGGHQGIEPLLETGWGEGAGLVGVAAGGKEGRREEGRKEGHE